MLELIDLRRGYGDVVALDGLSFTVPPDQVFGVELRQVLAPRRGEGVWVLGGAQAVGGETGSPRSPLGSPLRSPLRSRGSRGVHNRTLDRPPPSIVGLRSP